VQDWDYWETSCGESFYLEDGTPRDNNMRFCPYCGRRLEQMGEVMPTAASLP